MSKRALFDSTAHPRSNLLILCSFSDLKPQNWAVFIAALSLLRWVRAFEVKRSHWLPFQMTLSAFSHVRSSQLNLATQAQGIGCPGKHGYDYPQSWSFFPFSLPTSSVNDTLRLRSESWDRIWKWLWKMWNFMWHVSNRQPHGNVVLIWKLQTASITSTFILSVIAWYYPI